VDVDLVQSYEREEGAEAEMSASMAWRRRELAEELGDAAAARRAHQHARALARHLRKRARKDKHDAAPQPWYVALSLYIHTDFLITRENSLMYSDVDTQ
jgi:hypothetical protein